MPDPVVFAPRDTRGIVSQRAQDRFAGYLTRGGVADLPPSLPGYGTEANEVLAEIYSLADRLTKATVAEKEAQDAVNEYPKLRERQLIEWARAGEDSEPDQTAALQTALATARDNHAGIKGAHRVAIMQGLPVLERDAEKARSTAEAKIAKAEGVAAEHLQQAVDALAKAQEARAIVSWTHDVGPRMAPGKVSDAEVAIAALLADMIK